MGREGGFTSRSQDDHRGTRYSRLMQTPADWTARKTGQTNKIYPKPPPAHKKTPAMAGVSDSVRMGTC